MEGKGRLTLTGKLGDVMQESAQAGMSYIRSRTAQFGLAKDFYRHIDIHVHVPEGAIPKDGPSAGITIATALVSALTRIPARCDLAMTGEITLRGKVLPIGGLKEKMLAAHRVGIRTVIIPKENERDLADIPADILSVLDVKLVENMDEVLQYALETAAASDYYSAGPGSCTRIRAGGEGRPEFDQLSVPRKMVVMGWGKFQAARDLQICSAQVQSALLRIARV